NTHSNLDWSASSSGLNGVTFSPSNGTLTPGQSIQVVISVPSTDCPINSTLTFSGPANNVQVGLSCVSPSILTISEDTFTAAANCSQSGDGWTCSTTVTPAAGSQGNLDWTVSSSLSGVTFSPSKGTVSAGQSIQVNIFIPSNDCGGGSFIFTAPANTVTAT